MRVFSDVFGASEASVFGTVFDETVVEIFIGLLATGEDVLRGAAAVEDVFRRATAVDDTLA